MKNFLLKFMIIIINFTWGIIQNFLGLITMLIIKNKEISMFYTAILIRYEDNGFISKLGTFSIGNFIFTNNKDITIDNNLLTHEFGHTIQSIIFGPLALPIIWLFSLSWSNRYWKNKKKYNDRNIFYCSRFPEKGANYWGKYFLKQEGIYW